MPRRTMARIVLALGVLAAAVALAATHPARLGLDLRGGTQIVLEARDTPTVRVTAEVTDRTLEVLRRRVDALGVTEPTLARSGDRRIVVELPGVTDPRTAREVIGRTAQLTFHPVRGVLGAQDATDPATPGERVLAAESGERLRLGPAALTGEHVADADARTGPAGGWQVDVDFRRAGERQWAELTAAAACHAPGDAQRRLAIVLDGR